MIEAIAHISNDFTGKFGIPRQPRLVELEGRIIFEKKYRVAEAFRGIEGYSHIWLIWDFSENHSDEFNPTVRPPHLGGNVRVGVFASRSPYRPNSIGLSLVKLKRFEPDSPDGPVLVIEGGDLMNGTPIYDIKPYIPQVESVPDALGGFSSTQLKGPLEVFIPTELEAVIPQEKRAALRGVLSQNPRPRYQNDPERRYGLSFAGFEIGFFIDGDSLSVISVEKTGTL